MWVYVIGHKGTEILRGGGGVNPTGVGCIWTLPLPHPPQRLMLQGDQVNASVSLRDMVRSGIGSLNQAEVTMLVGRRCLTAGGGVSWEEAQSTNTSHACAAGEGHTANTLDKCSLEPRLRRDDLSRTVAKPKTEMLV